MTKGYTRPARSEDVQVVAADARPADVAEVRSSSGQTIEEALTQGLLSGRCMTICLSDGTPVGMYGVAPCYDPRLGAAWMLAANSIAPLYRQFLRESRSKIDELSEGYDILFNFTDARNTVHHRWINWAGFTIIKRHENYGVDRTAFLEFCKIKEGNHV